MGAFRYSPTIKLVIQELGNLVVRSGVLWQREAPDAGKFNGFVVLLSEYVDRWRDRR